MDQGPCGAGTRDRKKHNIHLAAHPQGRCLCPFQVRCLSSFFCVELLFPGKAQPFGTEQGRGLAEAGRGRVGPVRWSALLCAPLLLPRALPPHRESAAPLGLDKPSGEFSMAVTPCELAPGAGAPS